MSQHDWLMPMVIGGVFILLGLTALIWGKNEEKRYYDSISSRTDAREFTERWPQHPQFASLKIGGWITIAIGLLMLVMGAAFLLGS